MKLICDSRFFIWTLLALPSIPMMAALISGDPGPDGRQVAEMLLHPTGEFAARFMIIAMILTPMRLVFPKSGFWMWMLKRRRYFGVAAFCYAALHTALYVLDMGSLADMLDEFWAIGIWSGWLAFFVFIPLAVTSNDYSMRSMGRSWKILQRIVYAAAVATLIHWIFVDNDVGPALVHFIPLAALEAYRVYRDVFGPKQSARPTLERSKT